MPYQCMYGIEASVPSRLSCSSRFERLPTAHDDEGDLEKLAASGPYRARVVRRTKGKSDGGQQETKRLRMLMLIGLLESMIRHTSTAVMKKTI